MNISTNHALPYLLQPVAHTCTALIYPLLATSLCLPGYTEKGKSIANIKFEMKHVKKHVKYLKSMTKRWYCVLLKILTYLLSARFWL